MKKQQKPGLRESIGEIRKATPSIKELFLNAPDKKVPILWVLALLTILINIFLLFQLPTTLVLQIVSSGAPTTANKYLYLILIMLVEIFFAFFGTRNDGKESGRWLLLSVVFFVSNVVLMWVNLTSSGV